MSYSNSLFLESVVLGELEDPELQGSPLALWAAEYLWAEDREAEARLVEAKAAAVVWEAEYLWAAEDREADAREVEAREAEAREAWAREAAVVREAEYLWAALEDREAEDREAEADALAMDLEDLEDSGNW